MDVLAYFNGKFVAPDEPVLPIEERGHQFGDGIYEYTIVHNGVPFMLKEHMERLFRSAVLLEMDLPFTIEEITALHHQLIEKSGLKEAGIYMQVTRGSAPRKHYFPEAPKLNLSMVIRKSAEPDPTVKTEGVEMILTEDIRWFLCKAKTLNLLGNVLAKEKAHKAGAFEAIMYREATNTVTECSSSNIFAVKDGVIHTHPATNLILNGITRQGVIDMARELGYTVTEEAFTPEFLLNADEVFSTVTTLGVIPVKKIGDKVITDGKPGKITKDLNENFEAKIRRDCNIA